METLRTAAETHVFMFHKSNFVLFIPDADRLPRRWWGITGHRWVTTIEGFKRLHHAYYTSVKCLTKVEEDGDG
jgi:hypothetical protein